MKILPVGAELFHVDGRTDTQATITKLTVAFRNFTNAPKNRSLLCSQCFVINYFSSRLQTRFSNSGHAVLVVSL
jgi:hypothetical protein